MSLNYWVVERQKVIKIFFQMMLLNIGFKIWQQLHLFSQGHI